jgi:hypothetical protein
VLEKSKHFLSLIRRSHAYGTLMVNKITVYTYDKMKKKNNRNNSKIKYQDSRKR